MLDYRIYFTPIFWAISLIVAITMFYFNWILALIFLIFSVVNAIMATITYLNYLWWPYHNWIDKSQVTIKDVEIESTIKGQTLKATVIRDKLADPSEIQPGILFHHGYLGFKEKVYRFAIPLALQGFTILCPDARGHGETKKKAFDKSDFLGILSDVKNEITYLEKLDYVDPNRLMMMGHSMGAIMTLSAGYKDPRIKKLVEIAGPYDIMTMFNANRTILQNGIFKRITKFEKKRTGVKITEETLAKWNMVVAAKHCFKTEMTIPDKDRVYLVHCKEDNLVLFSEAENMKEALNLPNENVLFLEMPKRKYFMAGHNLTGQASIITSFLIRVAKSLE